MSSRWRGAQATQTGLQLAAGWLAADTLVNPAVALPARLFRHG